MASPGSRYPAASQPSGMSGSHPYPLHPQMSAPATYPAMNHPQPMGGPPQMMMTPTSKDYNIIMLCRFGQELVHDLIAKTSELFQNLHKHVHLPNGVTTNMQTFQDRRQRVEEHLTYIKNIFTKLRAIHKRITDTTDTADPVPEEQLVPIKGSEPEALVHCSESYRLALEEHRLLVEQVRAKNQQLKEIIDQIRSIIWEINTMMNMRKAT